MPPESAVATRPVEHPAHPAIVALQTQALEALLPDQRSRDRFVRVVAQAITRDPKLASCTPVSIVNAVIDAATWGLEPSGRVGGAYLVPYRVNIGTRERPQWESQAQMIPDYRGLVEAITRPPSPVRAISATLVHEGDDFTDYREGIDGYVMHRPSLASDRSTKPTTHAYAIAALATGERIVRVIDRSYAERIRTKSRSSSGPWQTDFDAMFRKTAIKAIGNNLPVRGEIRELIAREDVLEGEAREVGQLEAPRPTGPTAAARLGQRLRQERLPATTAPAEPDEPVEGEFTEPDAPAAAPADDGDPGPTPPPARQPRAAAAPAAAPAAAATEGSMTACDVQSPYEADEKCGLAKGHSRNHRARGGATW